MMKKAPLCETERENLRLKRESEISEIIRKYSCAGDNDTEPHGDEYYMRAALELAHLAARDGEVPVGCVVVRDGEIISADCNGREMFGDALYHAETGAIHRACQKLGGWRLTRCTMYVTLEPCPMCAGAIWCARIPRVVVGAKDARAGATGSLINLNSYPLNHKFSVTFGILESASRELLSEFFKRKR